MIVAAVVACGLNYGVATVAMAVDDNESHYHSRPSHVFVDESVTNVMFLISFN